MSEPNKITIVLVCDNHFSVLLATLIKSMEVNHKSGEPIELYIVGDALTQRNKKKLSDSINYKLFTIHWLSIRDVISKRSDLPLDNSSFPYNIYLRLFIPYFISVDIKKVIYLDVDMILNWDISNLWNIPLNDYIIGAAPDKSEKVSNSWAGIRNYKELRIAPESKYFNSGLMLIDPVRWRKENITEKIINVINNNKKFADFPDQYGLNVVFANEWLEIDKKWNTHSSSDDRHPYIIHFTGIKPIFSSYNANSEYRKLFFHYMQQTEWRNFKICGDYRRILKKLYNKIEKGSFPAVKWVYSLYKR